MTSLKRSVLRGMFALTLALSSRVGLCAPELPLQPSAPMASVSYSLLDALYATSSNPSDSHTRSAPKLHSGTEYFYRLPSQFVYDTLDGLSRPTLLGAYEHAQATVRYAWLASPGWTIKLGLVTNVNAINPWLQMGLATPDRLRNASTPQLHVASEGMLSPRWMISLDAQSSHLLRSQAMDLDLRLDYRLTSNFDIYGAYRLSDAQADGIDMMFNPAPANLARIGLRLRF